MSGDTLPDFANPPVVETVLGVGFLEVPELTSAQIVRFWDRELARELPSDAQSPPYDMPIERFPSVPAKSEITLTARNEPRPPRFLFFDNNHLVQLQSDWYAYNWRKTPFKPDYERYESGRSRFKTYLAKLRTFLREELSAEFQPKQGEVTYVNHIPVSSLEGDPGPLGMLLNDVQPRAGQYLPEPRYANVSWGYDIQAREVRGRLHVTTRTEIDSKSGQPQITLILPARGEPSSGDIDGVLGFLDHGREWIVRGFQDVTTSLMYERWVYRQKGAPI